MITDCAARLQRILGMTMKSMSGHYKQRCSIKSEYRISKITLACAVRNAGQRLSAADVCGRVGAGARGWRDRPWSAYGRESRAGVCAFASMADKCVS